MCQLPKLGGCNFLDLESEVNAFATKWIQRLVDPSKAIWKDFIWYKITNIIDPFPLSFLPKTCVFTCQLPTKIQKKLVSQMGGIWSIAFRTYFSNPPKPTPLAELNIHDLRTTYIYYNDLIKIK
jgi:hypothetical protein